MSIMVSIESTRSEISLSGQLLVAMPHMEDPRFARTVVYVCAHSDDGAMGLVVNRLIDSMRFDALLDHLGMETAIPHPNLPVHFGGPVESSRGFVLHSADLVQESTLLIDDDVALTATTEMLQAIASGKGPKRCVLALGYAGWGAGQLDQEIQDNGWLLVPADDQLVFGLENDTKWEGAMTKLGIDLSLLSSEAGHA
ncbi:MAG: YqgE/AlgH family protein [Alphaproteobacteria bacterium]|nr:YqgE/AlgH family protein [Alphaproteobacteria bacterium]